MYEYGFKLISVNTYYDTGELKEEIRLDKHSRLREYKYYYKNGGLFMQQKVKWGKPEDYHDPSIPTDRLFEYTMKRFYPGNVLVILKISINNVPSPGPSSTKLNLD